MLTPTMCTHVCCKLLLHRCSGAHVFQTASKAIAGQCWRVHIWIPQCQWLHCDEGAKLLLWTCLDSFLDYSDWGFAQFYQCRYNQPLFLWYIFGILEKFCKKKKCRIIWMKIDNGLLLFLVTYSSKEVPYRSPEGFNTKFTSCISSP